MFVAVRGSRTSFRDWAKLRYMGDDIDGFRRLLAGYKLTIIRCCGKMFCTGYLGLILCMSALLYEK